MRCFSLLLCPLLCFSSLQGIYFGNPLSPQLPRDGIVSSKEEFWQFRLGYIGDYLDSNDERLSSNLQLFSFGCALHRKVLLEFMGGSSSIHNTVKQEGVLKKLYATGPFCYGGRIQGILKKWGKFVLGASASGLIGRAHCRYETVQGQAVAFPSDYLRWKTWQAGLGVARKNEKFVPYLGGNVSSFLTKTKSIKQKTEQHIGLIVGSSIVGFAAIVADVEARFFAEQGVTLACSVAF